LNFQESTVINNWAKSTATTKQVGTWLWRRVARHVQDGILLSCFVSFDFEDGAGTRARGRHRDQDKKENWNAQLGGRQESQPITR
jgi:hypothetical protein